MHTARDLGILLQDLDRLLVPGAREHHRRRERHLGLGELREREVYGVIHPDVVDTDKQFGTGGTGWILDEQSCHNEQKRSHGPLTCCSYVTNATRRLSGDQDGTLIVPWPPKNGGGTMRTAPFRTNTSPRVTLRAAGVAPRPFATDD